MAQTNAFNVVEATIEDIHTGYKSGKLTCHQLVQMYLDRIEAFDKKGPNINALITINADALKEADRLDAAYKASGPIGPLHGIPVIVKDQADVKGMPTTLGSLLFKDYFPDRDSFVAEKLRKAGAVILGKATLGELGGGDTHGSLFGSTRNPYDIERTVGGSSGGSAASVSANFSTGMPKPSAVDCRKYPLPAEHCVLSLKSLTRPSLRMMILMSWPPTSQMTSACG